MNILSEYDKLCNPPSSADKSWYINRGFIFERILSSSMKSASLEPRSSYKIDGEQIDGSFIIGTSTFLFEAKWVKTPLPASTLYQFKGKVDGKLVGTIGVFISMSGYSEDAVDALSVGKSINLILFDRADIDGLIDGRLGWDSVMRSKLRMAAEEGIIFFPSDAKLVTRSQKSTSSTASAANVISHNDLVIICEGEVDREILSVLSQRILMNANSGRKIAIYAAMGKIAAAKMANVAKSDETLIVVDGDNDDQGTRHMLDSIITTNNWSAVIPNPSIEGWLRLDATDLKRQRLKDRIASTRTAAEAIDLDEIKLRDVEFEKFVNLLLKAR
ncbi:MAG: hypothetical protein V4689_01060 [Verrucomicrobiota bacterium]